jgi:hypothetical protein
MATAVASGMRSMATKKVSVIPPLTTPSRTAAARSRRRKVASRGRATATKIRPAQHKRSQAVPAGPMRANMAVEAAAPICTMKMEQRAKSTPVARRLSATMAPF